MAWGTRWSGQDRWIIGPSDPVPRARDLLRTSLTGKDAGVYRTGRIPYHARPFCLRYAVHVHRVLQLSANISDRSERLRARLQDALNAVSIEIVDDSHKHVGHAGARDGRGHFSVRVVAGCFAGLRPVARHRLVYDAAGDLFETDIHALSIQALSPEELA